MLFEHSLAAAGRIDEHLVKTALQRIRDALWPLIGDGILTEAQPLHVGEQHTGTLWLDLVAEQKAGMRQFGGDLRALTARCRTQIQHPVPLLHIQHLDRTARTGLLQIEDPGEMIGMIAQVFLMNVKRLRTDRAGTALPGSDR